MLPILNDFFYVSCIESHRSDFRLSISHRVEVDCRSVSIIHLNASFPATAAAEYLYVIKLVEDADVLGVDIFM